MPISFARGAPSPEILPVEQVAEAARTVTLRDGKTILNYGPAFGYLPLREWIGGQHGVPAAQVLLTPGSLQGFNFLTRHLFADGGRAIVEAPTYDRTIGVLQAARAEIDAVPLGEDGLDLDRLEQLLAAGPAKLVYLIPTFQNPSGRSLSAEQRASVVELARAAGVTIFEDDPYRLVRYSGEPATSMFELARGEGVIFSSSFSKTAAPGLRVGYTIVPADLVKPLEAVAASTYISPPLLPQAAIFELIQTGVFEPTLAGTVAALRERRDAMLEALEQEFGVSASWSRPDGGYFLWLEVPGIDAGALFDRAAEAGVACVKGTDFYAGPGGESALRLAFSYASPDEIREGVRVLAESARALAGA